ncbi:AraC family transcriptional regulator [Fictibacillus phosphorivorans]|uniref:AraC family transcriptional regulator n=1 Tax=Fictibacillus phosphorivorans TaxID=1221500 RepID=UPI00203EA5F5|nr:AraC family transcriptional regulator [Fictibacillus phosphorivorans]MCM3717770.1 helix-turn-helix domain-containing protein [Fictibacillus phosphorivorans]MCM3776998.1 helix-turn-helix domain-containing protein [Fictibacillus phosphorivorans]
MYLIKESVTRLNQHLLIKGQDVTFRINYWGIDSKLTYNPVHRHSSFEICYVLKGDGTYLDDGVIYPLTSGMLFVSRPGIDHQIRSEKGLFLLFVCFEVDEGKSTRRYNELFQLLAQHEQVVIHEGNTSPAVTLWKSLLVPEEKRWALAPECIPQLAHALLVSFLPLFLPLNDSIKRNSDTQSMVLQQAKSFIIDNLDKELSLEMVAQYLNVSTRHLSRLFSSGIHENFVGFIRKERVKQATYLLKSTDLSIKEIADATGFKSVHYFTRVLKQEIGLPPGRFRKDFHLSYNF